MMLNLLNYIVLCAILSLTLNGCNEIEHPEIPQCTILTESMICTIPKDWHIPDSCEETDEDDEYICPLSEAVGYQATTPFGYEILFNDISTNDAELAKYRKKCEVRDEPNGDDRH